MIGVALNVSFTEVAHVNVQIPSYSSQVQEKVRNTIEVEVRTSLLHVSLLQA